ncbi:MAG TPA: PA2779 family protein [Vicinamibacteria bacterium]|nr:PA2779 family protein [Vicinamibacteria bacterium]
MRLPLFSGGQVMAKQCTRLVSLMSAALLTLSQPGVCLAGTIPSKATDSSGTSSRQADLAQLRDAVARSEVGKALSARGLLPNEVEKRLAQLSDEDLRSLASHVNQIQAAGDVPRYIWVLLAVAIVVWILVTLF